MAYHYDPSYREICDTTEGQLVLEVSRCPEADCGEMVVVRALGQIYGTPGRIYGVRGEKSFIYPMSVMRPVPREVPDWLAIDFHEAVATLTTSPKASAALSRRCLQNAIREVKGIKRGSLEREIDAVIEAGGASPELLDQLDAVRHIGNFAAHPIKSEHTGEVIDVEPEEAEWNLDVLEAIFQEWFVAPTRAADRKTRLNEKLKEAGKPEL